MKPVNRMPWMASIRSPMSRGFRMTDTSQSSAAGDACSESVAIQVQKSSQKKKVRSSSSMSDSMLKKPNATGPWDRDSNDSGISDLLSKSAIAYFNGVCYGKKPLGKMKPVSPSGRKMDLTVFKHMDRDQFMAYIRFLLWNYRVIDDRTRVRCNFAPPDPHPDDLFCKWLFFQDIEQE